MTSLSTGKAGFQEKSLFPAPSPPRRTRRDAHSPVPLQVLVESEQMRREADDIGPRAELDHWKKRMAKFNYLLDQIKSREVRSVLGVLNAAKSKVLKVSTH